MVIVTHEMSFARDVADRAIFHGPGTHCRTGRCKVAIRQSAAATHTAVSGKIPDAVMIHRFGSNSLSESVIVLNLS
jgi:cystine transport system ATP-binding protein